MATGRDGEAAERSAMIAVVAVLLSVACHVGGYMALSKVDFTAHGPKVEWKSNRFQEMPPMKVLRFQGDPMAETPERGGESMPAPKVDLDEAAHVDRLESSSDAPAAAPLEVSSESEVVKPIEVRPDVSSDVWMPRQEVASVTLPTVEDAEAALPRKVVPKVERVSFAEDVVPAVELMAAGLPAPLPVAPTLPSVAPSTLPGVGEGGEDRFGFAPSLPSLPELPGPGLAKANDGGLKSADEKAAEEKAAEEAAAKAEAKTVPNSVDVLETVDELVVAAERNAVEKLMDELPSRPLEPEVQTGLMWWDDAADGSRRYFRVTIEPAVTSQLPIIPKDVLFLVDASGSVVNSFRPTCTGVSNMMRLLNDGDRFNIVFFRNVFKPVFNGWREATSTSFQLADNALKRETAHGTTDVFASLQSILRMPRDPARPIVAVVASDGKPEGQSVGVTRSADIISRFSELNGGISSVYFYGISSSANAYLIDMIAARNRGDSVVQKGMFSSISDGLVKFNAKFAAPIVSDLAVVFAASSQAETYPRLVTNLCRGQRVEIFGSCPSSMTEVVFAVKGLAGTTAYESVFKLQFGAASQGGAWLRDAWARKKMHEMVSRYTIRPTKDLMAEMKSFSVRYGVEIPYLSALKEAQGK